MTPEQREEEIQTLMKVYKDPVKNLYGYKEAMDQPGGTKQWYIDHLKRMLPYRNSEESRLRKEQIKALEHGFSSYPNKTGKMKELLLSEKMKTISLREYCEIMVDEMGDPYTDETEQRRIIVDICPSKQHLRTRDRMKDAIRDFAPGHRSKRCTNPENGRNHTKPIPLIFVEYTPGKYKVKNPDGTLRQITTEDAFRPHKH